MASVRSGNKESPSSDNRRVEKGLEEDFNKIKLKEEISMAKELGGNIKQGKEVKKEQEKKEVVANKEVEVGPEEFLKHPLQVGFLYNLLQVFLAETM